MKKSFKYIALFFFIIIANSGCLKDSAITDVVTEENNGEKIIEYLESQGDFINSLQMPALDSAIDVHDHLDIYEVLDIRSSTQFAAGHIPRSKNIESANLMGAVKSISQNTIIIIVSQTGQAASYYTGLLRFAGFNNVYALRFGMVSWNPDFLGSWNSSTEPKEDFTNLAYERPAFTPLPAVTFDNSVSGIKEKILSRIQLLMSLSFGDPATSSLSTNLAGLNVIYNRLDSTFTNTFIVCFGFDGLYIWGPNGQLDIPGHPPRAVFYMQFNGYVSDLRSTSYLQTIPSSKDIVVYSKYGHSSAFVVAYLRMLGYNVKSLLFGAGWKEDLPQAYLENYAYDKGN